MSWFSLLRRVLGDVRLMLEGSATDVLAWEHRELQNLFALLVLYPAAGIPGPPPGLAMDLLPYMERELVVLLSRSSGSLDPLGDLFSTFEVV